MIWFDGSIWICLDGISSNLCCQEDFFHANFLDAGPDEEVADTLSPKPAGPSTVGMEAFVRKVLDAAPLKHVPELLELVKGYFKRRWRLEPHVPGQIELSIFWKPFGRKCEHWQSVCPETNIALAHENSFPPKEKD